MNGWVKINFDARVKDGECRGLDVVLRNSEGKVLATGTRKIECCWSVHMCEAAAAQFGLQVALRLGVRYAHLEGDSMIVVQAAADSRKGLAPIFLFYDAISILKCQFLDFIG
ncbi:unnamed protein product [Amaranthus hypochondriacus]